MYSKIMVPVDLANLSQIRAALTTAADLARQYDAEICYVGVTATTPTSIARTPQEYEQKLDKMAHEHASDHGQEVTSKCVTSTDPIANLDDLLLQAIDDVGADLLVMGTHLPRHLDAVLPAHGGTIASHTDISVFLVRANASQ